MHDRVIVQKTGFARLQPGLELQIPGRRAEGIDRLDLFRCEGALQLAVGRVDDLAHYENADAALTLRKDGNVIGRDLPLAGSFLAAAMIREAAFEDRQQLRPLCPD